MAFKLSRRAFLRGLGGTAVALPLLDCMLDPRGEAYSAGPLDRLGRGAPGRSPQAAGTIPRRYVVVFDGQSLGCDNDPVHDYYVPDTIGPDYDLKTALAPLADVKNEVTVVSGLKIPTANGGPVPAGGRSDDFHINSLSPLFSGVRSGPKTVNGPTSDQIVANAIAGDTIFKSLVYRVQASWYLNVSAPYGRDLMSYKLDASGNVVSVPAQSSPRAAYDALFMGFTPPDPQEAARREFLLRQRKSVLDLVSGRAEKLLQRLGRSDKVRLERHFDELRDLERRVNAIPPEVVGACMQIPDPGPDPAIGGGQDSNGGDADFDVNKGYSDEETRARLFCDLIHMALVCDLSRVASLMLTMAQSHMNMYPLTGVPYDLHEVGHSGLGTAAVSEAIAWHVKHFAYLVRKLRDTPEGAGNVLDSTVLVFLHEGGHGYDPSSGKQYSSHCTDNMACLIAGRAGGLQPGRHVVATDKHPANVLISAMSAVGVPGETLGEVNGVLPQLFA